ncbi:MAG: phosphoribosyltransferase [Actinomycetota bacterium]
MTGRETFTWDDFGTGCRELAGMVHRSGFEPDVVLAIARGGLLPGGAVAYALNSKNIVVVNVEFYTGVDQRLELPVMLPPFLTPDLVAGSQVLVVDDVADTGLTLDLVKQFCAEHVADVRCAVLYEKSRSVVKCDYVWRRTDDWIDFPWSSLPPVTV